MKKNVLKAAFVVAIAMASGINVFNAQKTEMLSDVALANVEALAQESETGDQFTQATCCVVVWDRETCDGCDGKNHTYAIRQ